MPTSGVTDWSLTATQICKAAAVELGAINLADSLTSDEETVCIRRMNGILKTLSVRANMFREHTGTITVSAGVGSGVLPQSVRDLNDVRYVNTDGTERPLAKYNRAQWFSIPNRDTEGTPTVYYYEQGVTQDALYFWPVPTVETTLKVDYSRTMDTVTAGTETVDIPQEWQDWLILVLAERIANMFGSVNSDANTVLKIKARAEEMYRMLMDADRPDSYYMETWDPYCG